MKNNSEAYNVLVGFDCNPALGEAVMATYDPRAFGNKFDRIRDVANTIFPSKSLKNSTGRPDFYARYLRAHKRAKGNRWGTYFERFISFGETDVNQLEKIIDALLTWKKKAYRAAFTMHTSSAETDTIKPLGNPCLQYVQLNCPTETHINLVAVYRNHDYFNKALGNFVGLSRLLSFIADESDKVAGTITCHSIHAYFNGAQSTMKGLARI